MKGMEEDLNPFLSMMWCVLAVIMFILVITFPPILAASAYTAVTIVVYRVCYSTISRMNPDFSDFTSTAVSFCVLHCGLPIFLLECFYFLVGRLGENNSSGLLITGQ